MYLNYKTFIAPSLPKMASYFIFSKALILLWLSIIARTQAGKSQPCSPLQAPKELAHKLIRDPVTLSLASTDFGHMVHNIPFAVFAPSSVRDISNLIKFSNSLLIPFTIAPRGQAHSVRGQAMTSHGVVVNMTKLNNNSGFRKGIIVVPDDGKGCGPYADVGGEQIWKDLLDAALEHGLTPLSWTNYLYVSIGGTLSNAGIGGQTFRFGPQISNVQELDVVTGKGDIMPCSAKNNSELFYAVLGGLGQFGIITRARIPLGPAPTMVKLFHSLYNDFSAFSVDQEYLISFNGRNDIHAADGLEGFLLLINQPQVDLSFYPASDQPRITSLLTQHGIIYVLELVKYYDNSSQEHVHEDVRRLTQRLKFIPTFMFEKDMPYEEYLNRIHAVELLDRKQGRWEVPHPWLDLFIPRSRISDFDQGVFKDIILKHNHTAGTIAIHPMNRTKWDDKMSAVIPDEEVFYRVSFLQSTVLDKVEEYEAQNREILKFCADTGIGVKRYLPQFRTQEEWLQYFGPKWKVFVQRKAQFDPNRILSPGQRVFN